MRIWIHVKWLHSVHANEPNGCEEMGGMFKLRLHRFLGNINPDGEDLLDGSVILRFRRVFVAESLTERGIYYANTRVHVDRFSDEELQPGLE